MGATILLVEDNTALRTLQRFVLTRAGFEVVECSDLGEAEQYLADSVPQVVVLDLNLPSGPGLSLVTHIDRKRTAILVMTAMNQQHTAQSSGEQADAFMAKPFEPAAFVAQIQALLRP